MHDGKRTGCVNAIALDHHLYDNLCDRWHKRTSAPQPYVRVYVRAFEEDYHALGLAQRKRISAAELPAMADTGCQSCLMGIQVVERMGLNADDLIPVTMTMRAANEGRIPIIGAMVVRFSGTDSRAITHETRQIAYITNTSDRIFLSRAACIDLGMVNETFPTIGEVIASDDITTPSPCPCPPCTTPPPLPEGLPMPATEENRAAIESWLKRRYRASTFKCVRIFDKSKPTCIATDWSKTRIGFWLLQKHCDCTPVKPFCCNCGWKVTLVGSRFTHAAESRYAPIEGEALAVADALDKARYFVLGCEDLIIAVDHKPLLKISGDTASVLPTCRV